MEARYRHRVLVGLKPREHVTVICADVEHRLDVFGAVIFVCRPVPCPESAPRPTRAGWSHRMWS